MNAKKTVWLLLSSSILLLTLWIFQSAQLDFLILNTALHNAIIFILAGFFSFSLTEFISPIQIKRRSTYRTAFLISSLGFGLLIVVLSQQTTLNQILWQLFWVTTSSFFGSFSATNYHIGWWENNAQPEKSIQDEVRSNHTGFQPKENKSLDEKRFFDIFLAAFSILISVPIWLVITFFIWWEDPGPVLFVKNSVGVNGINYKQLKFRSMISNAEKDTGPISGYEDDERVLFFGKFLRKTALDELPQLINILIGDMSYVGPRPQRTVLVHQYLQTIPEYAARHQVRPGLAGLAQVADSYHISPQEKLAWDLIYIENANLWFDLKIIFSAFLLVFVLRWLPNNDPTSTIRKLLKVKKPGLD